MPKKHHQTESLIADLLAKKRRSKVIIQLGTDVTIKPVSWVIHEWLAYGKLTILAGIGGTGKTSLAINIAAAITNKHIPLPDGTYIEKEGNVLILSLEDTPEDTLMPRFLAAGGNASKIAFIEGIRGANDETLLFDPAKNIPELNVTIDEWGNIALLIIDPIISAVAGDMNHANIVRRSLQPIVNFIERHNCACIGISHVPKGSAGKMPQERVLGSGAFSQLARMVWLTGKREGEADCVLVRAKSNLGPDNGGFQYSIQQTILPESGFATNAIIWGDSMAGSSREILAQYETIDDVAGWSASEEAKQFLLDLLENGPLPSLQVLSEARQAGHSERTIDRARKSLGVKAVKLAKPGKKGSGKWCMALPAHVPHAHQIKTAKKKNPYKQAKDGGLNQSQHSRELESDSNIKDPSRPPNIDMAALNGNIATELIFDDE